MVFRSEAPTRAFRIGTFHYPVFDGTGAAILGGRWNSPGGFVIYAAEHYSLALLEQLAHIGRVSRVPEDHVYLEIAVPRGVTMERVDIRVIPEWAHPDMTMSRAFGDAWVRDRRSLILVVPSVIAPMEHNVVINQQHPEFSMLTPGDTHPLRWDQRLFTVR